MIRISAALVLLAAAALYPGVAAAQGYPNKPIRVIVPASPADSLHSAVRVIAWRRQFINDRRSRSWN